MGLLDNNFNVSESDLIKEIAIRLVKLSRNIYSHKIDSNNVIYHEPHKNVKNKHNYYLSIGFDNNTGYYHIKWLSDKRLSNKSNAHYWYYTVYVGYTPIVLYDFDDIGKLLKQIERYENKIKET